MGAVAEVPGREAYDEEEENQATEGLSREARGKHLQIAVSALAFLREKAEAQRKHNHSDVERLRGAAALA